MPFPEIRIPPLLTQDCLLCTANSGDQLLCTACAKALPRLPAEHCPRCALPAPHSQICGHCLAQTPYFDSSRAAYRYAFPIDKLIQSFKYGHRLALANFLGQQLAELSADLASDLLIPMPLHPLRLRERGFNQALELARFVCADGRHTLDSQICTRIRHTPAQADLPLRERTKNMRSAFHCKGDLRGKRIVLVDDVMTTGASLNECARTLKLHGALSVDVLIVARALPKLA